MITIVVETMAISAAEVRETITRAAQRSGKPVVACSVEAGTALVPSGAAQVAEIPSPERTATALGHVCAYAQWRRRPLLPADEPEERSDQPAFGQIIAAKLAASPFLKARSGDAVHKSEVGAVALGLDDSEAFRAAYETMQARLTGGQRWRMAATG